MAASTRRWPTGTYERYGLDVTIRQGGPQVNHSPAVGRRQDRLQHGRQPVRAVQLHRRTTCRWSRSRPMFQKDPQVLLAHPDVGIRQLRRTSRARPSCSRNDGRLTFWLWLKQVYGLNDDQVKPYTFNPGALPGRQERGPAGLRHLRAVRHRAAGRLRAGRADDGRRRLRHLLDHDRDARRSWSTSKPDLVQRFVDAIDRGLVQLPLRRSVARPTR